MIPFSYSNRIEWPDNNRVCPFDLVWLNETSSLPVRFDNRVIRVKTFCCPTCGKQFIAVRYFNDLQVIGINGKDYINLNLPKNSPRTINSWQKNNGAVKQSLEDKIYEVLSLNQPLRPRVISQKIGEDWDDVKNCLYENRDDLFYRDEEFFWWINDLSCKWTHERIFYLANYIPYKYWGFRDDKELEESKLILSVKDGDKRAIRQVSGRMQKVVKELLEKYVSTSKVIFTAVPTSKVDGQPQMQQIVNDCYALYNHPDNLVVPQMFLRIHDVQSSHTVSREYRPSYEEHKKSIICPFPFFCTKEYSCIILDDITTTGTIMDVCRDILIEHGMPEENIFRMAFAKTK